MIKTNDGNVKLEGTGLDLLADFGVIVACLAGTMIDNYGISEKYASEKLHEIIDISIASIKNEGDAANDFS